MCFLVFLQETHFVKELIPQFLAGVGIDAPPEVQVHREEIFQRILQEREEADGTYGNK